MISAKTFAIEMLKLKVRQILLVFGILLPPWGILWAIAAISTRTNLLINLTLSVSACIVAVLCIRVYMKIRPKH